jgi:heme exporter protein CcmD
MVEGEPVTMDLQEFLRMGGYAGYVWSAYGLTALVLVWNWWAARRSEAEQVLSAQRRSAD